MRHAERFYLYRQKDETGVSGTGVVADGVKWPDGTVTLRWRGAHPSTVNWGSMGDVLFVHGHGGLTQVIWLDVETDVAG